MEDTKEPHWVYIRDKDQETGEMFYSHRELCFCPQKANHW